MVNILLIDNFSVTKLEECPNLKNLYIDIKKFNSINLSLLSEALKKISSLKVLK